MGNEWIVLFVIAIGVYYFVVHSRSSQSRPTNANFSRLVTACFGDRENALRLVRFEMDRDSRLAEPAATLRALERLQSDRSR